MTMAGTATVAEGPAVCTGVTSGASASSQLVSRRIPKNDANTVAAESHLRRINEYPPPVIPLQYSSGVKGCDTERHAFAPCVRIEQGFTMRIIFMGTSEFALPSLSRLVESEHEVVAVYTQPDRPAGRGKHPTPPPVKVWALERELPVLQPERVSTPEEVARLAEFRPDLIVAAAYGQILREQVLQVPSYGAINIHPSLLPRHRGASPVAAAILAGDEETGVTVMLMSLALDEGPILAQRRVPVAPEDTTGTLTERLAVIGSDLLMETLPHFASGTIQPQPQDPSGATYAPMVHKEDALIDWQVARHGDMATGARL